MRTETEARDGVWTVGDAGEVHFNIRDGALELGEVIDYQGWAHTLRRVDADAIELELIKGGVTWEFTAHYQREVLRVGIVKSIDLAEPGRYAAGAAGEVEVAENDGALTLERVVPSSGWEVTVADDDPTYLKATFTRSAVTWTFIARLDGGQLQIDSGYEVASQVVPDASG